MSYKGRKSGKAYTTPVSYYRKDNKVYCFTNGVWWKNFIDGAPVIVRLKGVDYPGFAKVDSGDRENKIDIMYDYFKAVPKDGKFYGVSIDKNGEPNRNQVAMATNVIVMVETELEG